MRDEKKRIKTAVVLAGGQGLRLRPLTNNCPKPMVKLLGKPLLEWIIEWLRAYGIHKIIIGVAYRKEIVMEHFGDGSNFDVDIGYSAHSIEGETGEGFRLAISRHIHDEKPIIAMNGDEITDLDITRLTDFHYTHNPLATVVTAPLQCPYGVLQVDSVDNNVVSFDEKPVIRSVLINTGIYVFDKRILKFMPEIGSIEKTTFPRLVKMNQLKAYLLDKTWITIDTIKDLRRAEQHLRRGL